jgi:signal transduction histidine kinase
MPLTAGSAAGLWLLNVYTAFMQRPGVFMTMVMVLNLAAAVFVLYKTWCSNQAATATGLVVGGNLKYRMAPEQIAALTPAERRIMNNLGSISEGMAQAVEEQMKSERMKTELITNVSHDIKTPLTSIINYTDLLRKETDEEKKKEYLEVLSRSAARLKKLTEDLVDASKASTGNVHTEIVSINVREMIEQAAAEYEEKLEQAQLQTVISHEEPSVSVKADGRLLWRVLSNLLSNCVKYAQPGTRVYIGTKLTDEDHVMISIKNISRDILNISEEELLERFVRGDQARSGDGSGLGLNIARSLTELMGGTFTITIDGDLFRADLALPRAAEEEISELPAAE